MDEIDRLTPLDKAGQTPWRSGRRLFLQSAGAAVAGTCWVAADLLAGKTLDGSSFRAGVARKAITPKGPIQMTGFAGRKGPSVGVIHDIWTKALAIEDARGQRVVIVTTDLVGLPSEVSDEVAARVKQKCGLDRRQLLLSASHTHSGPAVWPNLSVLFELGETEKKQLIEYRDRLIDAMVEVVENALKDLSPATLAVGHGSVGFAINRRQSKNGAMQFGTNSTGPIDHDVPVLRIAAPDGKVRAVLFGYACHNTSLVADCREINGDYAGFAQIEVEKTLPGATAMFMILCGGDQNPNPRGTRELSSRHGKTLGDEVVRILANAMKPVASPTITTAFEEVKLDVARRDRSVFEQELKDNDPYRVRRARKVLAAIDAGRPVWQIPLPIQVVGFGEGLVLLAIGGEVVVDYSLRLRREFAGTSLIVAGYCNTVPCYIPSRRVLAEGGYEPVSSMIYYGQPGPFDPKVEETVVAACRRLLARAGVEPKRR